MSIQNISNQIVSVDREMHSIENQIHLVDTNISRKQRELHSIIEKATREKDPKGLVNQLKEQSRKGDEIARLEKDKSIKSKLLADKRKKRNDLQVQLRKEEQKEREDAKKDQMEILSVQQQISREMEKQKNISLEFHFKGRV